jgi:hypothetical protein
MCSVVSVEPQQSGCSEINYLQIEAGRAVRCCCADHAVPATLPESISSSSFGSSFLGASYEPKLRPKNLVPAGSPSRRLQSENKTGERKVD